MTENRARYFYLLGRAHDVLSIHSVPAEEALAKAVKLDPKLVDAWNQLGECYWKKDNITEAKNCFQGALLQVRGIHLYSNNIVKFDIEDTRNSPLSINFVSIER